MATGRRGTDARGSAAGTASQSGEQSGEQRATNEADGLLDSLPDGVVTADDTGTVTRLNATAGRLLGIPDGVGKHIADVVTLQDRAGNHWYECTEPYSGLAIRTHLSEQAWYLSDGTELLLTARILRDAPAQPVQGLVVSLRSAGSRARLDRERSDLVATVAHELRSPLTGVKGFVATLLSKWDRLNDDQKRMMLETVNADADRLTRLIAELLDVARIDTGRLSLHPRPVDVAIVVDRVIASVRAGSGREIVFDLAGDLPRVSADQDKFVQVVTNLVDNAIRHGDGQVRLTASPIRDEAPYDGVLLHVDDEGDGISPDIRSRVFTKFWKHGTRGGTGLGMYIIHGLVDAHGGSVEIDDSPAGGARVSILWPNEDRRRRD
jgi:signal transduction histidine kinase